MTSNGQTIPDSSIIFDLDGTIADSFDLIVRIGHQLIKDERLADLELVKINRDDNVGLAEAFKTLKYPKWKWPFLLFRGRKLLSEQMGNIPLTEGISTLLTQLSNKKNLRLFIVSSNSSTNVIKFLKAKKLSNCFERVYGGAGLLNKGRLIKKLIRAEGLDLERVIYVGDEVRDIEAARQAKLKCIAVSWGYNSRQLLANSSPYELATNIKELTNALNTWLKG